MLFLSQGRSYHKDLPQVGCCSCEAKNMNREGALSVTPFPIFHSGRLPEDVLFPLHLPLPGAPESPEDTDPTGIQIDLTTLTLTPGSFLRTSYAKLNGVLVFAIIDSGAQGHFYLVCSCSTISTIWNKEDEGSGQNSQYD